MKKNPLISVCLPVLNAGKFLGDRLDSIFKQTFDNWELVVVDGFSDDGTWESLQQSCGRDPRVRLHQQPRQGIYAAFNRCIDLSVGEYIYIATADDTMEPTCLEQLLTLAQSHDKPCIAQCGLTLIDESGSAVPESRQWPANAEWFNVFGDHFQSDHTRAAPFDGAAVLVFGTLITSLTQALFPREAYVKYGGFPSQFGSAGDMAWEALIGFFYDVKFTPQRLATWRLHDAQATAKNQTGVYDRDYQIGTWVLKQLEAHDENLWRVTRRLGLIDYRRFASIRHSRIAGSLANRILAPLQLTVCCPRFYSEYRTAKRFINLGQGGDAVTAVRSQRLSAFIDNVETRPAIRFNSDSACVKRNR